MLFSLLRLDSNTNCKYVLTFTILLLTDLLIFFNDSEIEFYIFQTIYVHKEILIHKNTVSSKCYFKQEAIYVSVSRTWKNTVNLSGAK